MKSFNVGAIGARTTAFKTVRVDEIAFQKRGINIETIDLSDVFDRMEKITPEKTEENRKKILEIAEYTNYPDEKLTKLANALAAFEEVIKDFKLDAVAIRCWNEFETILGIAPCICLSLLNEVGISAACEVDITNAVMMRALSLASDSQCMLLDYNNNYGESGNKAIMFHCGPIAPSLTIGKGKIIEHLMFKKSFGDGSGVGVLKSHIKPGNITFGSIKTENGKIWGFVTEAKSTDDVIEEAFFGSGTVVEKEGLSDIANYMAENGYKHHVAVTYGDCASIINEAFSKYLDFEIDTL
jgi:L-fucose isomerase-like protein